MFPRRKTFFTKEKKAEKCRLQEKRKDAFHRQRLSNDAARSTRKLRPVGAELKFHGNASYHSEQKVDGKYLAPEARSLVVALIVVTDRNGLEHHNQQRQA